MTAFLTTVGNAIYFFCTDFMIGSANLLGWTYVDTNSILLLVVFPLTPPVLAIVALWQWRALRRLQDASRPVDRQDSALSGAQKTHRGRTILGWGCSLAVVKVVVLTMVGFIAMAATVSLVIFLPTTPDKALLTELRVETKTHRRRIHNRHVYLLIDLDRPIFRKRLWVIEARSHKILFNSHISHALLSGLAYASDFSNERRSFKTSPGAYLTANAYNGHYGRSRRLIGLNRGLNHNARRRAVVLHKSWYPWSGGCLTTRPSVHRRLMQWTRKPTLIYVHKGQVTWLGRMTAKLWRLLPLERLFH